MTVCRHGFNNGVMIYILQFAESAIHRIFVAWVEYVKVTFSCLNLKPRDGFLPYHMCELFNKTGHGLTIIIIAWDELKPVLYPKYFQE